MRSLERDTVPVFVARFSGLSRERREDGSYTGELVPSYEEPELVWATVTVPTGDAVTEVFGQSRDYLRVLRVADPEWPIGESDLLYIDTPRASYGSLRGLVAAAVGEGVDLTGVDPDYKVSRIGSGHDYTAVTVERMAYAGAE